jgi:hypothetical protein
MIRAQLRGHAGYRAIQTIHGIGPTVAAILVAEMVTSPGSIRRRRCARGRD